MARDALEMVIHNRPNKSTASDKMRDAMHRTWFLFPEDLAHSLERMRQD
ncbi:MAG TPA: hypothetical protein VM915_02670 [Verrucomicrobiae bacterium]|jgi:hypothetical protein|nr:hypothetical protein [Verrucomicrobiae bacterium]